MKRALLTVISVCLVLAAIFGIYAGAVGLDDISAIVRYTNNQRQVVAQIADETEKGVTELEAEEEQRKQDLLEAAEGSVVEQIGGSKLANGELQYEAGKDKLNAGQKEYDEGKAQYDAAKALYDEKLAEYNNACERLEEGKAQLADAKAQRDAGQKKLDEATPAYNELKIYVDLANGKVYEHTRFLADPIARLYGYDSVEAVLEAYEAGQQQLADANVQIADAEKQIADGEKQLADAKVQLDEGKKQLDEGKSRLDSAKAELDAGRRTVSESVENLQNALDSLKAYDDAESKVKAGVAELMKIPGIAEQVEDESDYRSVVEAARSFIESNKDGVNAEMTVRQRLYVMLIVACAVCAAAGVAGIIASLTPTGVRLATCAIASVAAAALSVGFMIYGLVNGSHSFAYFYMDKLGNVAGDGRLQFTALLIAAVAALCTAALALLCRSVYNKVLLGVSPEEGEDDIEEAPVEVEEPAPENEPAPAVEEKPAKAKAPAKAEAFEAEGGEISLEELAAETRRLNEEATRMEENAQNDELLRARREYEEAKKRFDAARRNLGEK